MNQQIWLFRHGIAEKKSADKEDFDRALTPKGKKELEAAAPNLRYLLDAQSPVFIWSSPLTRAIETADIISQSLGKIEINQKECIATGDLQLLTTELKSLPKESTVIVVGHEPALSVWAESLTGVSLPFDKGSCAAFQMKNQSKSDLLWFHQPKSLKTLGSKDTKEAFKVRLLLQDQLRKIQSLHDAFLKNPADEEIIHQLRVNMRQLRSMLSFLKPLLPENVYQEAREPLREAFHQFSLLRELDVLIKEIHSITEEVPDLLEEKPVVLSVVSKAREKEKRRLVHSSNQKKIRTILSDLLDWAGSVDWVPLVLEKENLTSFAKKRIKKKHKTLQKTIQQLDYTDIKEIHTARINAKKYRYMLKSFSHLLDKTNKKERKQAKKLQKSLSKATDIYENILALDSFIANEQSEPLKKDFAALKEHETTQLEKQLTDLEQDPLVFQ